MQVGREQQSVATIVEQRSIGQRAGGDDATHRPLGRARLAHLFGDDDSFAQFTGLGLRSQFNLLIGTGRGRYVQTRS